MKKLLIILLPIFLFFGCDEIPPSLGTEVSGPVTGPVVQKALIEEFTGVRCVNCPAGSEAIEQLIDIHGDRLFAISIHAGSFSFPYEESDHDFKVEDGVSILNFLGSPQGYPTAVVDRKKFEGEQELQLAKTKWAGYIDQQLANEPVVGITLTGSISEDRVLSANAQVQFLVDAGPEEPRITLLITESNIEDPQETPDGVVLDYKHKHVLRDIITPFDGEPIDGSSTETISLDFTTSIPSDWNTSELTVIAVIHNSVTDKVILNVEGFEL